MTELLYSLDIKLLYFINHTLGNPVFDVIMPLVRNKLTWLPLYLFLIFLITKKYGLKSIWVIWFAILAVIIADQLSSGLIKPYFHRLRPCNNPELANWLNLPNGRGSNWSFVSSHATNHFALAVYFIMVFNGFYKKYKIVVLFLLWAFLTAFAQVYIGFHYPSDVICGGILGSFIGYGIGKFSCFVLLKRSKKPL